MTLIKDHNNKGSKTMNGGDFSNNALRLSGIESGRSGVRIAETITMIGGTISGNTALSYGGGVFFLPVRDNIYSFSKTGGTITDYTIDKENGNSVIDSSETIQNFMGHAVFVGSADQTFKIKESTAGPEDNLLSYLNEDARGVWDN